MSTNQEYLKTNRRKLEMMNDFLKVKNKPRMQSYTLDCTHKRLNALPLYQGLQDNHLNRHFMKRGIYETLISTGVIDKQGNVRPKNSDKVNYENAEQLSTFYQDQKVNEVKLQQRMDYYRGINKMEFDSNAGNRTTNDWNKKSLCISSNHSSTFFKGNKSQGSWRIRNNHHTHRHLGGKEFKVFLQKQKQSIVVEK